MGYKNLKETLLALEKKGELLRVTELVDPVLEAGIIQRRVFEKKGPALLFTNVKDTPFPMAANIFGTIDRTRFLFKDTLKVVDSIFKLKLDPFDALKHPLKYAKTPLAAYHTIPKKVSNAPVLACKTSISKLPKLVSWPQDGGGYITLPQVYTESPSKRGFTKSNIGMYRVQLSGNDFIQDKEAGLHYQIHRGIGHHHAEAIERNERLPVNIFVGGAPAMTLAAVMPLPEGLAEILFAGLLGGHRIPMARTQNDELPIYAEADFCICGYIEPKAQKPEGPFGDHLGYYSLVHDFPLMHITNVYHRKDAIWPFTTVARPPQEDTMFGEFIHELTAPIVSTVFSGVHEVHAVDAAGVHPLLLAVGSERYVPYALERQPQELLTNALSLLGNTQTSLTKYLFIAAKEDNKELSCKNEVEFILHILERIDFARDLHFITRTTMDTLDYSGISLNQGSKLIVAATGEKRRELCKTLPKMSLPEEFGNAQLILPGIACISAPKHSQKRDTHDPLLFTLEKALANQNLQGLMMLIVCDDASFTSATLKNFLWVTFTRSDPATDIYGVHSFTNCKHWGCDGTLIIDARLKTYHAPALTVDDEAEKKADRFFQKGASLYGL